MYIDPRTDKVYQNADNYRPPSTEPGFKDGGHAQTLSGDRMDFELTPVKPLISPDSQIEAPGLDFPPDIHDSWRGFHNPDDSERYSDGGHFSEMHLGPATDPTDREIALQALSDNYSNADPSNFSTLLGTPLRHEPPSDAFNVNTLHDKLKQFQASQNSAENILHAINKSGELPETWDNYGAALHLKYGETPYEKMMDRAF